jgi:hypothetical protein
VRGFARYASRLRVGIGAALAAWLIVAYDETIGSLLGRKLGPRQIDVTACDPDIAARYL